MASPPHIALKDLCKSFGPKRVLDGVSLSVPRGRSLVVIGGSGTGKSVMIKCILGLLRADSGSIAIGGKEVSRLKGAARDDYLSRIGMLFQGAALFDSLPVWENVAFGLIQGKKAKRDEARDIAMTKLRQVGLGPEVALLRPAELSGGMQKRVALARSLALDPEVVLFDEPTTGLDPITSATIGKLIQSIQEELGVTAVVVTHDLPLARRVGDRLGLLAGGRFVFLGDWQEADGSQDPQVADFLAGREEDEENVA